MSKIVLVAQLKGGCGKSNTAMQIIAPWLLSREGRARLIEVDHHNQDSEDYKNTAVMTQQIGLPDRDSHSYAAAQLMEGIVSSEESIVIDLGGNSTSMEIITEIGRKGISAFVDLVVVPVSAQGRDVINARATIEHIKKSFSGFEAPILIVYSRAVSMDLDRLRFEAPDIFSLANIEGVTGPMVIPQKGCFASSRYLLQTAWEIANNSQEMMQEIQQKQVAAKKERDVKKGSQLVTMRDIVEEASSLAPFFEAVFEQLDGIFPADESQKKGVRSSKSVEGSVVKEATDE